MWFFKLLSLLPLTFLYGISNTLAWIAGSLLKYRAKVIDTNLKNSFPSKSNEERSKIKSAFYKSLSDVIVEAIYTLSISKAEMLRRVQFTNSELLLNHYHTGKGVIVLAGHQANWEWCLVGFSAAHKLNIDGVYRPLHNRFFDRLMISIRGRFKANLLPANDTSAHLKRHKNDSRILALVADQTPSPKGAIVLPFLNQATPFFRGPELMAAISEWPVLYIEMARVKRGCYTLTFHPVLEAGENVRLIMPRYATLLEKSINTYPEQWLWSHRRWKHKVSLPASIDATEA